tara:strand:- start:713 stop:1330 length:618 start_codon:yes stop_codon:yes gene_type:complete
VNKNFYKGIEFLKKDSDIGTLIKEIEIPHFPKEKNYFRSLIKFVIYQQLSIKSARKIYDRLISLFNKKIVNPKNFKSFSMIQLQKIGISKSKIHYMNEIADRFIENDSFLNNVEELSNKEIINQLTEIKGIGPWTSEMFLMFTLQRLDIFSIKDLGIKKGIQKLFKLDNIPTDEFMIKKSKKWSPYRTIACLYLWKLIDENNFDW